MEENDFIKSYKKKQDAAVAEHDNSGPSGGNIAVKQGEKLRYEQKSEFRPPEDGGMEERAKIRANEQRRRMIFAGVITVITAACLIVLVLALRNPRVKVPDFTSWKMTEVQAWFEQNSGIILNADPVFNDEVDENLVISQQTQQGVKVKKGDIISLTDSKGHDMSVTYPVPDFMSMTREEVEKWAGGRYMSKLRVSAENNDKIPAGNVIRFEINDNKVVNEIRRDTPVYVIVSKGPESASAVKMEDFKGAAEEICRAFADEKGIKLSVIKEYSDLYPAGTVISQSVKAEQSVPVGGELVVTVSKGKKIIVPDFSALSREAAGMKAAETGINIIVTDTYSASKKAGAFISQSRGRGTVYDPEDIVELKYSLGNTVAALSFVGQTAAAMDEWAAGLNSLGANITIKSISTQSSMPKGTIIRQDIENMSADIGAVINIIISLGLNGFVPDFVAPEGATYETAVTKEEALLMCAQANLIPVFVAEENSGRLPGEIWSQDLPAGREVPENTTVTLKYRPVSGSLSVPDFTGKTQAEVIAGGYMKQFKITFETVEYVPGLENKIAGQSARAGSSAAPGTPVTLYISESF